MLERERDRHFCEESLPTLPTTSSTNPPPPTTTSILSLPLQQLFRGTGQRSCRESSGSRSSRLAALSVNFSVDRYQIMEIGKHKSKRKRDDVTVTSVDSEEGELISHDDLLEPQEQLSKRREEEAVGINCTNSPTVNNDIDQNIREIRAILKMNAEILDRCMKFSAGGDKNFYGYVSGAHTKVYKWSTAFRRINYEVVTTRARNEATQVITHPISEKKTFNTTPLSKLPEGLDDIIVSRNMGGKHAKYSSFIDFEVFFQKSLLLHETVLEAFLPKLKEHLMSIQVCLGEIDAWVIQEPQININFLEEALEKKMEIPDATVPLQSEPPYDPNDICLHCKKKFCDHYGSTNQCNENVSRPITYNEALYYSNSTNFACEYYQVLMQCDGKGKYESRFKKFLEYMSFD
jgi:hypothetical protein